MTLVFTIVVGALLFARLCDGDSDGVTQKKRKNEETGKKDGGERVGMKSSYLEKRVSCCFNCCPRFTLSFDEHCCPTLPVKCLHVFL